jgi:hypothetical protein
LHVIGLFRCLTSSWFNFGGYMHLGIDPFLLHFPVYLKISLLVFVVMFPFSSPILLIWVFYPLHFVMLAKGGLSVFFSLSKEPTFYFIDSLYSIFWHQSHQSWT